MRINLLYLITFSLICINCNQNKLNLESTLEDLNLLKNIDTFYLRDIDHDKIPDSEFVTSTKPLMEKNEDSTISYNYECDKNRCFNVVLFSNNMPKIKINNSIWSRVENTHDINKDGKNELLICNNWFSTTLSNLYLFSYSNNHWQKVDSTSIRNPEDDSLINYIIQKNDGFYLKNLQYSNGDEYYDLKKIDF